LEGRGECGGRGERKAEEGVERRGDEENIIPPFSFNSSHNITPDVRHRDGMILHAGIS